MLKVGGGECGRGGGVGGELEERVILRLIVCTAYFIDVYLYARLSA